MNAAHAQAEIARLLAGMRQAGPVERAALGAWLLERGAELAATPEPGVVTATIKRRIPSQNKSTYEHWTKYHAERRAWAILMRAALRPLAKPPEHLVVVEIDSFRTRLLDFANLVGGAKPIPDTLIDLNYLRDDSPRWARISYRQHQVPAADERTVLTIHPGP